MLFHTWIFCLFFLVIYPVYLLVRRTRFKDVWLLIASYVFYAWWNPLYLVLIVCSTAIDYVAVIMMDRTRRKRPWLALMRPYSGWTPSKFPATSRSRRLSSSKSSARMP